MNDYYGRCHPGQMALNGIKTDHGMRSRPVSRFLSGLCISSYFPVPTLFEFIPWLPSAVDCNVLAEINPFLLQSYSGHGAYHSNRNSNKGNYLKKKIV